MSEKRHPPSSYKARYPYNRVTVTESGHEFHWDDTKGAERIRIAHRSGSYTEWSHDGRRVDMTVGHGISYVKGGLTQTVDKNADVKVGGSTRSSVAGDSHSETKGTVSQAIGDGMVTSVGGDQVSAVGGDQVQGIVGSQTSKVGGDQKLKVDGDVEQKVGGSFRMAAGGGFEFSVGGMTIKITSSGFHIEGGSITHDGVNIGRDHRHEDVEPGPSLTGPPV